MYIVYILFVAVVLGNQMILYVYVYSVALFLMRLVILSHAHLKKKIKEKTIAHSYIQTGERLYIEFR